MPVVILDKREGTQHTLAIDYLGDCLEIKRRLMEKSLLNEYRSKQIYVHVPYCFFHCSFCVYKGDLLRSKTQTDAFLEDLHNEVGVLGPTVAGHAFDSVFIGGGTVTVLDALQLRRLLVEIRTNFLLRDEAGEFCVELAPHGLTQDKLDVLVDMGVNRVTMGLQSLDPSLLSSWNRPMIPMKKIKDLIDAIHQRPFADFNVDLMIDVKARTFESLVSDFECLANWGCHSIMIYIDMREYRDLKRQERVAELKQMVKSLADRVAGEFVLNGGGAVNEYNRFVSRKVVTSPFQGKRYTTDYRSSETFCLGIGRQAKSWTRDMVFHWH